MRYFIKLQIPKFRHQGFTLLELVISVAIMMLLVGMGVATYLQFNERQQVTSAAKELQELMRSAQTRSRSGDVPPGCGTLSGYLIEGFVGSSQILMYAVCSGGNILRSSLTLTGGVAPVAGINMTFQNLKGGVTNPGIVTLRTPSLTYSYSFLVSQGGEISQGALQ